LQNRENRTTLRKGSKKPYGKKPLSPTNDFIFHKVFAEHKSILISFLQSVLDLPADEYEDIKIVDPSLKREYFDDKLGILDIKVYTTAKKIIDVEIQVRRQAAVWKRLLFYSAKLMLEQVKKGNDYKQINKVITIYIADHILIKDNDIYHNYFQLYDKNTKKDYHDSIAIHTLELPKIHKSDGTLLYNWMQFLRAKDKEDFMIVAQTNPTRAEACDVRQVLSADERIRALAEAREKAYMDYDTNFNEARSEGLQAGRQEGLQEGRQEGIQIGEQKGRQEERLAVAVNALRKKIPVRTVAEITGLSVDEVNQIAAGLID
jgi:predicted transposase/invertase (TIGR01784 family)